MKVHVLHENPDWFAPIGAALDAEGVPYEQWLLGEAVLDLAEPPPPGVFWSRMSASSHTRGHPHAKDQTRGVLSWLEAHGRRVVNGRRVLELEMSKVDQLVALRAAGFDVPRTVAVAGTGRARGRREEAARAVHQQAQPGRQGPRASGCSPATRSSTSTWPGRTTSRRWTASRCCRSTCARPSRGSPGPRSSAASSSTRSRPTPRVGGFQLCPADACAVGRRCPRRALVHAPRGF